MEGIIHLIGHQWRDGNHYLIGRSADDHVHTIRLEKEIYLKQLDTRQCIGWIDFAQTGYQPCPNRMAISKGMQCEDCIEREGLMPCVMCNGSQCPRLKPQVKNYCISPHYLYLAAFDQHHIKVGTASEHRKYDRLLEQGPAAAAFIAKGTGPVIKQMEKLISGMGYTQYMRQKQKWLALNASPDIVSLQRMIMDSYIGICEKLPAAYQKLIQPLEFMDFPHSNMTAREVKQLTYFEAPVNEIFGGEYIASAGSFVILNDRAGNIAINLNLLRSWMMEVNPRGKRLERAQQLELF